MPPFVAPKVVLEVGLNSLLWRLLCNGRDAFSTSMSYSSAFKRKPSREESAALARASEVELRDLGDRGREYADGSPEGRVQSWGRPNSDVLQTKRDESACQLCGCWSTRPVSPSSHPCAPASSARPCCARCCPRSCTRCCCSSDKRERLCGYACAAVTGLVSVIMAALWISSALDMLQLQECLQAKPPCSEILVTELWDLCADEAAVRTEALLMNPSGAASGVTVDAVAMEVRSGSELVAAGSFDVSFAFAGGTGQPDWLPHIPGVGNVTTRVAGVIALEDAAGVVGSAFLNRAPLHLDIAITTDVTVTAFWPLSVPYTSVLQMTYVCGPDAAADGSGDDSDPPYVCVLGDADGVGQPPPPATATDPPLLTAVHTFRMPPTPVAGSSVVADLGAVSSWRVDLGASRNVIHLPALQLEAFRSAVDVDPFGPDSPHLRRDPFVSIGTTAFVAAGDLYGGPFTVDANSTLPPSGSATVLEDLQAVVHDFLVGDDDSFIYVKGAAAQRSSSCRVQQVVSSAPPLRVVVPSSVARAELQQATARRLSGSTADDVGCAPAPGPLSLGRVDFLGARDSVLALLVDGTMRLPFDFSGIAPAVSMDLSLGVVDDRDESGAVRVLRVTSEEVEMATPASEHGFTMTVHVELVDGREIAGRLIGSGGDVYALGMALQGANDTNLVSAALAQLDYRVRRASSTSGACDDSLAAEGGSVESSVNIDTGFGYIVSNVSVLLPPSPLDFVASIGQSITRMTLSSVEGTELTCTVAPIRLVGSGAAIAADNRILAELRVSAADGGASLSDVVRRAIDGDVEYGAYVHIDGSVQPHSDIAHLSNGESETSIRISFRDIVDIATSYQKASVDSVAGELDDNGEADTTPAGELRRVLFGGIRVGSETTPVDIWCGLLGACDRISGDSTAAQLSTWNDVPLEATAATALTLFTAPGPSGSISITGPAIRMDFYIVDEAVESGFDARPNVTYDTSGAETAALLSVEIECIDWVNDVRADESTLWVSERAVVPDIGAVLDVVDEYVSMNRSIGVRMVPAVEGSSLLSRLAGTVQYSFTVVNGSASTQEPSAAPRSIVQVDTDVQVTSNHSAVSIDFLADIARLDLGVELAVAAMSLNVAIPSSNGTGACGPATPEGCEVLVLSWEDIEVPSGNETFTVVGRAVLVARDDDAAVMSDAAMAFQRDEAISVVVDGVTHAPSDWPCLGGKQVPVGAFFHIAENRAAAATEQRRRLGVDDPVVDVDGGAAKAAGIEALNILRISSHGAVDLNCLATPIASSCLSEPFGVFASTQLSLHALTLPDGFAGVIDVHWSSVLVIEVDALDDDGVARKVAEASVDEIVASIVDSSVGIEVDSVAGSRNIPMLLSRSDNATLWIIRGSSELDQQASLLQRIAAGVHYNVSSSSEESEGAESNDETTVDISVTDTVSALTVAVRASVPSSVLPFVVHFPDSADTWLVADSTPNEPSAEVSISECPESADGMSTCAAFAVAVLPDTAAPAGRLLSGALGGSLVNESVAVRGPNIDVAIVQKVHADSAASGAGADVPSVSVELNELVSQGPVWFECLGQPSHADCAEEMAALAASVEVQVSLQLPSIVESFVLDIPVVGLEVQGEGNDQLATVDIVAAAAFEDDTLSASASIDVAVSDLLRTLDSAQLWLRGAATDVTHTTVMARVLENLELTSSGEPTDADTGPSTTVSLDVGDTASMLHLAAAVDFGDAASLSLQLSPLELSVGEVGSPAALELSVARCSGDRAACVNATASVTAAQASDAASLLNWVTASAPNDSRVVAVTGDVVDVSAFRRSLAADSASISAPGVLATLTSVSSADELRVECLLDPNHADCLSPNSPLAVAGDARLTVPVVLSRVAYDVAAVTLELVDASGAAQLAEIEITSDIVAGDSDAIVNVSTVVAVSDTPALLRSSAFTLSGVSRPDASVLSQTLDAWELSLDTSSGSSNGDDAVQAEAAKPNASIALSESDAGVALDVELDFGIGAAPVPGLELAMPATEIVVTDSVDAVASVAVNGGSTTTDVALRSDRSGQLQASLGVSADRLAAARDVLGKIAAADDVTSLSVSTVHGVFIDLTVSVTPLESSDASGSATDEEPSVSPVILRDIQLIGGEAVGDPIIIPCLLDTICPPDWAETNAGPFHYTAAVTFELDADVSALSGWSVAVPPSAGRLDCCEFTPLAELRLVDGLWITSAESTVTVIVRASIVDTELAKHAMDNIGLIDLRFRLHGLDDGQTSLSSLLAGAEYVAHVAVSDDYGASNAEAPPWFMPLHSSGSWELVETTPTSSRFEVSAEIPWPVDMTLRVRDFHVSLVFEGHQVGTSVIVGDGDFVLPMPAAESNPDDNVVPVVADVALFGEATLTQQQQELCPTAFSVVDRRSCAVAEMIHRCIAREETELHWDITWTTDFGDVLATMDMLVFRGYWDVSVTREEEEVRDNLFALVPPGPPTPVEYDIASAMIGLLSGDIVIDIRIMIHNVFAFPITVTHFGVDLLFDDRDGAEAWFFSDSYDPSDTPVVMKRGAEGSLGEFALQPGELSWTPWFQIVIEDNSMEVGVRLYDEIELNSRLCLHIENGYVDMKLQEGNDAAWAFTQPFALPQLSMWGPTDCIVEPECPMSSALVETLTFDGNFDSNMWATNGACACGGELQVTNDHSQENSAFLKAKRYVLDRWAVEFTLYTSKPSFSSGDGDGIAFVLQPYSSTAVGEGADSNFASYGSGYRNMPAPSLGVVFNLYDEWQAAIAGGGATLEVCETNSFASPCTSGRLASTTYKGNVDTFRDTEVRFRVSYDGLRKLMDVDIAPAGEELVNILHGHVNLDSFDFPNGEAFVGFTGSTGYWYYLDQDIRDFTWWDVQTDAEECVVKEDQRAVGVEGQAASITLDARDACGHERMRGGDSVEAWLKLDDAVVTTITSITDDGSGVYVLSFTCPAAGTYDVVIRVHGVTAGLATVVVAQA